MDDVAIYQKTIDLAIKSITNNGGPFSALIVKDGKIIGTGINQVSNNHDPTAHAEIMAIRDACQATKNFELTGCTLYASSEPCPMCLSAIYWTRLDRVFYLNGIKEAKNAGFDDSFIYKEIIRPNSEKKIPIIQSNNTRLVNSAKKIFQLWQEKTDRINY
ncbi:MAG: nucleoside deaminase [Gammaproteobacteria bacterium]|nr:nucleoside deaminase [Gammaproteobacteria bacterium]